MTEPAIAPLSLARLRDAHVTMLQQMNADEGANGAAFLAAVEAFQARAQASGATIAGPDERSEVQSTINFWQTIRINGGQRPATMLLAPFDQAAARIAAGGRPPYKGLSAFHDEDSPSFFGRYAVVRRLVGLVKSGRLLAVTGLSGSGKSSVVRGGLIPQLRDGAFDGIDDDGLTDSSRWLYPEPILPGAAPIAALAAVWGPITTAADLPAALDAKGVPVVLTIDQFEEVFTLSPGGLESGAALDASRRLFLDALVAAASGGAHRHVVVVTMRSEFDSYVRVHEGFAALFNAGRLVIDALPAADLRQAIELPAERLGVGFDAGLVDELVNSVLGEPAGLPLLQFTLLQLWYRRGGEGAMQLQHYKDMGGNPRVVLARSADAVFEALKTEQDRTLTRRIFTELVTTGSGQEATGRRRLRHELDVVSLARDNVNAVLVKWRDGGMIRISPAGEITPESAIEVAHEALVRNWKMLVTWVEEVFVANRNRRAFRQRADGWRNGTEPPLGELALAEARGFDRLEPLETDFIMASERAVAENKVYERRQTRRWLLVSSGILLSELLIFGAFAYLVRTRDDPSDAYVVVTMLVIVATLLYIQFIAGSILRQAALDFLRRRFKLSEAGAVRMQIWVGRGIAAAMVALLLGLFVPPIIAMNQSDAEDAEIAEIQQKDAALKKARDDKFQATSTDFDAEGSVSNKVDDWPIEKASRLMLAESARSVGNASDSCPTASSVVMVAPRFAVALMDNSVEYDLAGCTVDFATEPNSGDASWVFKVKRAFSGPDIKDETSPFDRLEWLELAPVNAAGNRLPRPLPLAIAGKANLGNKNGDWPVLIGYRLYKRFYVKAAGTVSVGEATKVGQGLIVGEGYSQSAGDPSYDGGAVIDLRTGNVIAIHFGASDRADPSAGDTAMLPITPALVNAARKAGVSVTVATDRRLVAR